MAELIKRETQGVRGDAMREFESHSCYNFLNLTLVNLSFITMRLKRKKSNWHETKGYLLPMFSPSFLACLKQKGAVGLIHKVYVDTRILL